jgi:hypothetical protein
MNYCIKTNKTIEFINKAKEIHGDIYDYSKVVYDNNLKEVIIICKEHGEFLQLPKTHKRGNGCIKCGRDKTINSKKSNTNQFINKSKEIHGDKYDYSKVEYKNAREKIKIICKIHGEFLQTPNSHLRRKGCRKCSTEINSDKQRKTTNQFIKDAIQIHGDKYDYSKVEYKYAIEKVIIICKEHGEFLQSPNSHLIGSGCNKCAGIGLSNTEEFIEKSIKIHGNKYDYTKVNYIKSNEKIIIICKKHGEFSQITNSHLHGRGCELCGKETMKKKQRTEVDDFIKNANIRHNNKYDYSKINYINARTKIIIICKEHGEFLQIPSNHLRGSGCNICNCNYSLMQINWLNLLENIYNINIAHMENGGEYKIPNTNFKADGYCKEINTIYEFHGDYWHGNPNRYNLNEINKVTKCTFGELYEKTLKKET